MESIWMLSCPHTLLFATESLARSIKNYERPREYSQINMSEYNKDNHTFVIIKSYAFVLF